MPVDLDGRESAELPLQVALWDAIDEVVAASGGSTTNVGVARQKAVVRVHDALRPLADELRTLRARVAELERPTPSLEWIDLRTAHEPMREMLALSYEQGRRDALREAIDLCQRTEAGDTNHDWREAAKCCRELIESLAAQAAEETAQKGGSDG